MAQESLSLLGSTSLVTTPFIKVTIGDYIFGYYNKDSSKGEDARGVYTLNKITYPNYIQDLTVQKINGTVNRYTLKMVYAITENDDPNFFEKVFSSVSKTRKIVFSYGDLSMPSFCYKDEEAIITDIKNNFVIANSTITYTISAVSSSKLVTFGAQSFPAVTNMKPSDVIKQILYNQSYGLLDVFYGMRDKNLVEMEGLIASNDVVVPLEAKTNISVLDYLMYLVECMRNSTATSVIKDSIYSFIVVDEISSKFKGPYFKVVEIKKYNNYSTAYSIDIGYPSQNVVTSFNIENDESYSLYYDYSEQLSDSKYVQRINDSGEIENVFAPTISSGNALRETTEASKNWWTRVTQYPIKATITFKGLLRPAILMTHVRLNVYFYGRKHISSGIYVVTEQYDKIGFEGFKTTLKLLRIDKEELE